MNVRNVKIKLKANCAAECTRLLESKILPLLRKQKGFRDEITFVAPDRNEAIAISFWKKQDDADAYNHIAYLDVLVFLRRNRRLPSNRLFRELRIHQLLPLSV